MVIALEILGVFRYIIQLAHYVRLICKNVRKGTGNFGFSDNICVGIGNEETKYLVVKTGGAKIIVSNLSIL